MKKKFSKILPLILSTSMIIGNVVPAFADERATLTGSSSSAETTYWTESSNYNLENNLRPETEVTLTTPEYFSVVIPKKVQISGQANASGEYEQSYTVTVKGDISGDKYVKVEAPEAVLSNGNKKALTVNMNSGNQIVKFLQNDGADVEGFINLSTSQMGEGKATSYLASVSNKDDVKAGTYSGTTKFDIGLFFRSDSSTGTSGQANTSNTYLVDDGNSGFTYETTDTSSNTGMGMINALSSLFGVHTVHADILDKEIDESKIVGTAQITNMTATGDVQIADFVEEENGDLYRITGINAGRDTNNPFYSPYYTIGTLELPEGITEIPDFFMCGGKIEKIIIPASVTRIGVSAFFNCKNLSSVEFKEGSQLTIIDKYAFNQCDKLTEITIPDSVKEIGAMAFYNSHITKINSDTDGIANIPNGVEKIGSYAFKDNAIVDYYIPTSVKTIDYSAFTNSGRGSDGYYHRVNLEANTTSELPTFTLTNESNITNTPEWKKFGYSVYVKNNELKEYLSTTYPDAKNGLNSPFFVKN